MQKHRELTTAGMLTAIMAVSAQILIPIWFTPVPITLQLTGVFLAGCLLKPGYAVLSMAAYLLLGLTGLPVFTGYNGGPGVLLGATGGFLIAFPIMALVISIIHRTLGWKKWVYVLSITAALMVCYTIGVLWFIFVYGSGGKELSLFRILMATVIPFIGVDILKGVLSAIITERIRKVGLIN